MWPWSKPKPAARQTWRQEELHDIIAAAMERDGVELAREGVIKLADRVYAAVSHDEAAEAVWRAARVHPYQRDLYECNHIACVARGHLTTRAATTPWPAPAAFGLLYTETHAQNLYVTPDRRLWILDNDGTVRQPLALAGKPVVLLLV